MPYIARIMIRNAARNLAQLAEIYAQFRNCADWSVQCTQNVRNGAGAKCVQLGVMGRAMHEIARKSP